MPTPTLENLVASESIQYYDCVRIALGPPHDYYITQAPFDITLFINDTYKAAGGLLNISQIVENAVFSIDKINISVAGIVPLGDDSDPIMVEAQTLEYIDKPVTIYRCFMHENQVAHVTVVFAGFIDSMNITYAPEGDATQVSVDVSSHWSNFDRVSTRYTNNTSQQEFFPNDVGFEYSVDIQKEVVWRVPGE